MPPSFLATVSSPSPSRPRSAPLRHGWLRIDPQHRREHRKTVPRKYGAHTQRSRRKRLRSRRQNLNRQHQP